MDSKYFGEKKKRNNGILDNDEIPGK